MAEKKTTDAAKTAAKTAAPKKSVTKKTIAAISLNAENVGFRAGDVYNALASEGKALSVAEIAKLAKITTEEVYLGIGWLLKEGKVNEEDNKVALA